tara:strand:+ start:228 stop:431 length:204 start_codon:yes stop_codon:yes gene_type:complete
MLYQYERITHHIDNFTHFESQLTKSWGRRHSYLVSDHGAKMTFPAQLASSLVDRALFGGGYTVMESD